MDGCKAGLHINEGAAWVLRGSELCRVMLPSVDCGDGFGFEPLTARNARLPVKRTFRLHKGTYSVTFCKPTERRNLCMGLRDQMGKQSLAEYVDDLQVRGRYAFTTVEAQRTTELRRDALKKSLSRLERQKRIVVVRRGFCVIVPLEYQASGIIPPGWFIGDLMKFLGQPYYVALLSAAEIHGAAHQRPQTYQVITSRPTRDVVAAGLRIRFFKKEKLTATPTIPTRTFTGDIPVSNPAATAFDLVAYARRVGRLNRVMTVLQELGESIEADSLVTAAKTVESACVQRTGWLLDKAGFEPVTGKLNQWFMSHATKMVALDPSRQAKGCVREPKWRVIVNAGVEGEL